MFENIFDYLLVVRKSKPYQSLKRVYLRNRPYFKYLSNKSRRDVLLGKDPIFIYNHVPKCGGTSFKVILNEFFLVISDYPPHEFEFNSELELQENLVKHENNIPNYLELKPYQTMAGHYFYKEIFLSERFRGIYECSRVKLISFLRDPLTHRVSLYSFGVKKGHSYVQGISIEDFLFKEKNYFSTILECDINNYKERLDNYFFIGIMEDYEKSVDLLSKKMEMKIGRSIPNINKSDSGKYYALLSDEVKKKFKELNYLDYLIYDYSRGLLNADKGN